MGEKERGKPDLAQESQLESSTSLPSTTSSTSICAMANHTASFTTQGLVPSQQTAAPINGLVVRPNSNGKPEDLARPGAHGWQTAWKFIYEKWRLCAFIALAVIVSRFSTMGWTWLGIFPCQVSSKPFLIIVFFIFRSLLYYVFTIVASTRTIDLIFTSSLRPTSSILRIIQTPWTSFPSVGYRNLQ